MNKSVSLFVRLWVEMEAYFGKIQVRIRQPLREAVSWNTFRSFFLLLASSQPLREAVSWNLWKCILISANIVSLFVRLWVEILSMLFFSVFLPSASSWGCELKWCLAHLCRCRVLSASSWGCELKYMTSGLRCTCLPSASSWGCELKWAASDTCAAESLSASSWGCELKYGVISSTWSCFIVSLFVRLWVEILKTWMESVSLAVSLFVRLWVEISHSMPWKAASSVSLFVRLWVEIHTTKTKKEEYGCQPLREAVSWNIDGLTKQLEEKCQPLREAVSWNFNTLVSRKACVCQPLREAVSWNGIENVISTPPKVSLFVRLWVEINPVICLNRITSSASSWGCELKCQSYQLLHQKKESASSWGCELKWYMLHEAYSSK